MTNFLHSVGYAIVALLVWLAFFVIIFALTKPKQKTEGFVATAWFFGLLIAFATFCLTL